MNYAKAILAVYLCVQFLAGLARMARMSEADDSSGLNAAVLAALIYSGVFAALFAALAAA